MVAYIQTCGSSVSENAHAITLAATRTYLAVDGWRLNV